MKATGIVRQMDGLGRIVLPSEIRRILHIRQNDPLEIYTESDSIILRKYTPACFFCGSADDLAEYDKYTICRECIDKISKL